MKRFTRIKFIPGHNSPTRIIVLTAYGSTKMEKRDLVVVPKSFIRHRKPLSRVIEELIESPSKQAALQV